MYISFLQRSFLKPVKKFQTKKTKNPINEELNLSKLNIQDLTSRLNELSSIE